MTSGQGSRDPRARSKKRDKTSPEHSARHIEALYEISKQLTRFDDIEVTLPRIIEIVATHLPLRTAICIQRRDDELSTWSWSSPVTTPEDLHLADERAKSAYAYLTGHSVEQSPPSDLQSPAIQAANIIEFDPRPENTQLLTLPLAVERAPTFGIFQLGALFVEPAKALDKIDLAFVNAVANQLAIAIDRQRAREQLLRQAQNETAIALSKQAEAEKQRVSAEISQKHEHLLAEAGALLVRSLDYNANIEALARLLVPTLADWCMIDMVATVEPDIIRLASTLVVHADKAKEAFCKEVLRCCPPDPNLEHGVPYVVRTGESELHPDVTTANWIPAALGLEYPALMREIDARSYMCVPLKARAGVVGAITLIYDGSGRRYGKADLALAENFAWRAGAAIDNARLYEVAQNAIRVRDDLLGIVSHDLRNPLGVILLHTASLLQRPDLVQLSVAARKQLEGIRRSAGQMTRLIQDLLDAASIEAGHVSVEPQQLAITPLISEAIEVFEPLAASKTLRIEVDIAPDTTTVFADSARFQQILANLVSNAIKFTPTNGVVTVGTDRQSDFVRFTVRDTGPGIADEDLPHVFDRFWQARRTAGLGTGLGLFISKGLVETQGGRLWVESILGRGTTFYFTLPVAPGTNSNP